MVPSAPTDGGGLTSPDGASDAAALFAELVEAGLAGPHLEAGSFNWSLGTYTDAGIPCIQYGDGGCVPQCSFEPGCVPPTPIGVYADPGRGDHRECHPHSANRRDHRRVDRPAAAVIEKKERPRLHIPQDGPLLPQRARESATPPTEKTQ